MKFYNTAASSTSNVSVTETLKGGYELSEGEVILELSLGLGQPGKNAKNSLATLRGTDPVGGFYRNSTSGDVFMKAALSAFIYEGGKLSWGEDGLPKTALVNGVLRVNQVRALSPEALELANYFANGSLLPVDPKSAQADIMVQGNEKAMAALKELRGGNEIRRELMTRDAWTAFRHQFFGGDYPVFFANPAEGSEWERELENLGSKEELKNYTIKVGFRLRQGNQPCWTQRDESTVGTRKGSKIEPVVIPGTDMELTTRPVTVDIAYIEMVEGKNRVVDPSKCMNKKVFQSELDKFLASEDSTSEGFGYEVLNAQRSKWNELKETLRGESGKKKAVKARKDLLKAMASDPSKKEELEAALNEIEAMVKEQTSPHWHPGVLASLKKEIETIQSSNSSNSNSVANPEVTPGFEAVVEEEEEVVKPLSSEDLDEAFEEPAPVATRATGSASDILARMRARK